MLENEFLGRTTERGAAFSSHPTVLDIVIVIVNVIVEIADGSQLENVFFFLLLLCVFFFFFFFFGLVCIFFSIGCDQDICNNANFIKRMIC